MCIALLLDTDMRQCVKVTKSDVNRGKTTKTAKLEKRLFSRIFQLIYLAGFRTIPVFEKRSFSSFEVNYGQLWSIMVNNGRTCQI